MRVDRTRTVQYFLGRFESTSVSGAIEKAAQSLLAPILPGMSGLRALPVQLEPILLERAIAIGDALPVDSPREALLIPEGAGFVLRLRPNSAGSRKRFTLAHEIAHTLFFQPRDGVQRHQIGAFSEQERAAEEAICDQIASALLAPADVVGRLLGDTRSAEPNELLEKLDRLARGLKMSIGALVRRISAAAKTESPHLVLSLRYEANRATRLDPKLRVHYSTCLMKGRTVPHVWRNSSATTAHVDSAAQLFSAWRELRKGGVDVAGRFMLDQSRCVRWDEGFPASSSDVFKVAALRGDAWQTGNLDVRTSTALYAPSPARDGDASMVVIAKYDPSRWRFS